ADVKNAMHHTAHQIAKINHLNRKKTDAFMHALLEKRADLAGLPFAMGDDCRTKGDRSREFAAAVEMVRHALRNTGGQAMGMGRATFPTPQVAGPVTRQLSTPRSPRPPAGPP